MKINRREFITKSSLVGFGLAGGSLLQGCATIQGGNGGNDTASVGRKLEKNHVQRFNMSGFAVPPLEKVRVGIIGTGQRGPAYVSNLRYIEGVEIKALCDIRPEKVNAAKARLKGTPHNPDVYTGEEDWKKVCEREDIDLVVVTTPWYMHAMMAVYAMKHGKHAASEVSAAGTIEECWLLVETAEQMRRHCMMMANSCYLPFQLLTLNMARQGIFGEVVHGDCAYNTSKMRNNFSKSMYWDMWWLRQYASRKGNIYPIHGLGPVSTIMNINRGDKFEFLVSVESNDFMMKEKARELAATDDFFKPFAEKNYRGNMSVTTIRTTMGRTITLQHDATDPSPHNNIHGIYGTKGAALYDPQPPRLSIGNHAWVSPEEFKTLEKKYTPKITQQLSELAKQIGAGHGGTDLLETWRLIDCLRNGLPLDMDVYDAAAWSSVVPLSQWSVLNRSNSIDVPDFTAGAWKTNKPNMDINLERGGNTKVIV
ncbi:MAG: Gfo/Idh/MocA family oxidoreductase [Kiritimatiellae bacterium]|nr:Gfo/Idh/MocA family oxidoreductase [Kiritimatiellia bacterium]